MNETLNNLDQLRSSAAPSAILSIGASKEPALADQIQFSSLLRTFVETPQEALTAAQGPKKPFDRLPETRDSGNTSRQRNLTRSDGQDRVNKQDLFDDNVSPREAPREISNKEKPKVASVTKDALRGEPTKDPRGEQIEQVGTKSSGASMDPKVKNNEFLLLAENPNPRSLEVSNLGANKENNTLLEQSMRRTQAGTSANSNSNGQIASKVGAEHLLSALTDREIKGIGKDLS